MGGPTGNVFIVPLASISPGVLQGVRLRTVATSIRLSEGGGLAPRWRADGRELFYLKPDGAVMSIEVDTTHQILATSAKRLFAVPDVIPNWGVTPDGARFLFAVPVAPQPPFNIVQAWRSNVRWFFESSRLPFARELN